MFIAICKSDKADGTDSDKNDIMQGGYTTSISLEGGTTVKEGCDLKDAKWIKFGPISDPCTVTVKDVIFYTDKKVEDKKEETKPADDKTEKPADDKTEKPADDKTETKPAETKPAETKPAKTADVSVASWMGIVLLGCVALIAGSGAVIADRRRK